MLPTLCCEAKNCCPALNGLGKPGCTEWPVLGWPDEPGPFSFGGRGLFLKSFNVVVEEVGVLWLELAGDWA